MSILSELQRRNVFRVAALYLVAGWVLLQVAELLFGALGVPAWGLRLVLGLLLLGFPLALIFSWVYELTPEGLKREHEVERHASTTRETGRKINLLIASLLVVAIGVSAYDVFARRSDRAARPAAATPSTAGPPVPALVSATSIAVLPFINMSDDRSNEYFSDGLTEELLNLLARVPELKVIARTSSFAYKGKEAKISDIARELQVANVLEGSVRRSGDRVRITAQLIRASDSTHLWSESYDRTIQDIFAVQGEIAGEVVDSLKVELLGGERSQVQAGGTKDARAYEAYLRGRYELNKGEAEQFIRSALAAFDEAVALDSSFALAHASRASALLDLTRGGYVPFAEGFPQARSAAERALELAPEAPEGHVALGRVNMVADRDWQGAEESLRRAAKLKPSDASVYDGLGNLASLLGKHDEAVDAGRTALSLDPLYARRIQNLAMTYYRARRYDEASATARQALVVAPGRPGVQTLLGLVALQQGELQAASATCEQEPIEWQRQTCLAIVYEKLGRAADADAQFAELKKNGDSSAYQYAQIHAQRGESDEAMHWLEVGRRVRDPGVNLSGIDPLLDPLRKDPRFTAYLRGLGLAGT
jgi:adenylate cyclase